MDNSFPLSFCPRFSTHFVTVVFGLFCGWYPFGFLQITGFNSVWPELLLTLPPPLAMVLLSAERVILEAQLQKPNRNLTWPHALFKMCCSASLGHKKRFSRVMWSKAYQLSITSARIAPRLCHESGLMSDLFRA